MRMETRNKCKGYRLQTKGKKVSPLPIHSYLVHPLHMHSISRPLAHLPLRRLGPPSMHAHPISCCGARLGIHTYKAPEDKSLHQHMLTIPAQSLSGLPRARLSLYKLYGTCRALSQRHTLQTHTTLAALSVKLPHSNPRWSRSPTTELSSVAPHWAACLSVAQHGFGK